MQYASSYFAPYIRRKNIIYMISKKHLLIIDHPIHPPKVDNDPWECEFLPDCGYIIKIVEGVYTVYKDEEKLKKNIFIDYPFPHLDEFIRDMHLMCALIADGPLKSFCYRRLSYLSSKFQLHVLLNELRELAAQKAVAHRDFYNVRKVLSLKS